MVTRKNFSKNKGFALLDLLIAIIIVAVGTIAFMRLQINANKRDYDGYMRSQALTLIANVTEILRSNTDMNSTNPVSVTNPVTNLLIVNPSTATATVNCVNDAGCMGVDLATSRQLFVNNQVAQIQNVVSSVFPADNYANRFMLCIYHSPATGQTVGGVIMANYRFVAIWLQPNNTGAVTNAMCPTNMGSATNAMVMGADPGLTSTQLNADNSGGFSYVQVFDKL